MAADNWTVAEAKAGLDALIEQAQSGRPQTITCNGRPAVVVVAAETPQRETRRTGNLAEFLAASPLRQSGVAVDRRKDGPRTVAL